MRKLTFLTTFVLITIISCGSILGQKKRIRDAEYFPRHEFYIQYGAPTILELTSTLSPSTAKNVSKVVPKNAVFSGVGGLGYNFFITEQISIGIYAGVSLANADIYYSINEIETLQYSSNIINYTSQISAHWIYYEEGALQASSGVYLGLNYRDDSLELRTDNPIIPISKTNSLQLAYHLTAIKLRYGNIIGGFAELGFGYRGLVNIGLSIML